MDDALK
jgi:hypothetical protein